MSAQAAPTTVVVAPAPSGPVVISSDALSQILGRIKLTGGVLLTSGGLLMTAGLLLASNENKEQGGFAGGNGIWSAILIILGALLLFAGIYKSVTNPVARIIGIISVLLLVIGTFLLRNLTAFGSASGIPFAQWMIPLGLAGIALSFLLDGRHWRWEFLVLAILPLALAYLGYTFYDDKRTETYPGSNVPLYVTLLALAWPLVGAAANSELVSSGKKVVL